MYLNFVGYIGPFCCCCSRFRCRRRCLSNEFELAHNAIQLWNFSHNDHMDGSGHVRIPLLIVKLMSRKHSHFFSSFIVVLPGSLTFIYSFIRLIRIRNAKTVDKIFVTNKPFGQFLHVICITIYKTLDERAM